MFPGRRIGLVLSNAASASRGFLVMQRSQARITQRRCVSSISATDFMNDVSIRPTSEFQVVDVREPYEHDLASLKNIIEVVNLPLSEIDVWGNILSHKLDSDKTIYCLCHHGVRSMRMAQHLEKNGFDDVVNISGGIAAIAADADSSIGTY